MTGRPLSRIQPVGPVQAYKTYQVATPRTHTRPASCEEVGCEPFLKGWTTKLHRMEQADLVWTVRSSGRPFTEAHDGPHVLFVFEPGTPCFKARTHRVQVKPEIYVVRGGDWRGQVGPKRTHTRPEHWVEDFALHQDRIIREIQKG